jgi:acetyltransferase-like isoleucine patch superfamily enzyme
LADGVALDAGVVLLATGPRRGAPRIAIGRNCYINRRTYLDATVSIEVGADVMIGPACYITDHDHGIAPGVPISEQTLLSAPVVIEEGAWLGAGVIVLKGSRIGKGAIVGAGAVVTRNVPPGSIAAGTPAEVIGWRQK